jgi:LacI family transcriptional regulator
VRRLKFLREILALIDTTPWVYESPGPESPTTTGAELLGMLDEEGVVKWLKSLPNPVGLLASNDIRAQQVLVACRTASLRVPDEVAVIGVDNDDVICPLCDPQLSSVEPDTEQVGYVAASLLNDMIDGQLAPAEVVFVPPRGVVERRSTEMWAVGDDAISHAYSYIRDSITEGINVGDVVRAVGLSRRALERRMAKELGKTPHELIASFRLRRLQQLLEDTDLPMFEVASLAGFEHVEHMHLFFKRHTGTSPGRYRNQQRHAG